MTKVGIALPVALSMLGVTEASRLAAQSPTSATGGLAFEVASIKPNRSQDPFRGIDTPPGRLIVTNLTVREMIGAAYDIPPPLRRSRMTGGPGWIDVDRFDVVAKAEGTPSLAQRRAMFRTLLADRFKLVAKIGTRDMPVYHLVLARADRKLGPQLRKVPDVDCVALRAALRGNPPPISPGVSPPCGVMAEPSGVINASAIAFADLVRIAFPRVVQDRVVIDKTGLTGTYSVNVTWTPAPEASPAAAALAEGLPVPPPPTAWGPSIFTALQEQLGLKLESQRGPVEVLVIDSVDRPTPD
jgi:uncharacterized protein (TIGR03435 family)